MSFQELLLGNTHTCSVCLNRVTVDELHGVSCGHMFCAQCWDIYCQVQIQQGITTGMEMSHFICICWHSNPTGGRIVSTVGLQWLQH